jgi:hypothetical protein
MIDKSIRQYYENGKEVGPVTKGMKMIWDPIKQKYFPQDETGLDERQLLKNVAGSAVKNIATRKLATQLGGTGILSSLGPIGMIIAMMLARKGIGKGQEYLTQKLTKGGVEQAFQAGFGSPEEQRELRQLEKRRANMLQRKNEGRNYSEKNLDIVTRAIAEAKGLDINNPNEMRNIDKPITQIRTERSITEPVITHPTFTGEGRQITTPKTVTRDMGLGDAGIAERIAAENRAAATQAAAIKAEMDRQQRERDAAAARAPISVPVPRHISGGGGQNGGQRGSPPTGTAGRNPWGRAYGGRIDKALGGRSRDIG